MKTLLCTLCFVCMISGCASSGRIGVLPAVEPGKPAAMIFVYRISSLLGVTNSFYITLDGREIFSLRSGEHTGFIINAGEHMVGAKCFGGMSPTWKETSVIHTFTPESENFFEIGPSLSCAQITAVSADEFKKNISGSTFIDPGKVSD